MADANKQLGARMSQEGVAAFSIEHENSESECEAGPRIELDLTCGLVDLQDDTAVAAAEQAAAIGDRPTAGASDSSSTCDSSGASEDDASSPPSSTSSDASSGSEPDSLIQATESGCAARYLPTKSSGQRVAGAHQSAVPSAKRKASAAIQLL